jgi:hypothetical protein
VVWSAVRAISHTLGVARGPVRRLGGLCLVWMGVHAAADVLDDRARDAIDVIDLVIDEGFAHVLGWLAAHGGMTPDGAVATIERFATAVDLAEKDWLAVRLALVVELVLDVALLDLAWGTRPAEGEGLIDDLRASTRQLRASLSAFDLERLLGPLTLLTYATAGGVLAGLAIEQPVAAALVAWAPGLLLAGNLAAGLALVVAAVVVWRFGPDLGHGALVRAHERGEADRARRQTRREQHPPRFPAVARVVDAVGGVVRGWWLAVALFVACAGLVGGAEATRGQGVLALAERLGAAP